MKTITLNERQVTELRCTLQDAAHMNERAGYNGLATVARALYESIVAQCEEQATPRTLYRKCCGSEVILLKTKLGLTASDDLFGCETENFVLKFQASHGLKVDGIVGPLTWRKLLAL